MMMPQQVQMPPMPASLSMPNFVPRMYSVANSFEVEVKQENSICSSSAHARYATVHGSTSGFPSNGIQWSKILIPMNDVR